jgi:HlyD family secretion protein
VRRLLLLALAIGCTPRAPAAEVPVVQVKKQKFSRVVDADGTLRAVKATPVAVPSDVPFTLRLTWLAADGSVVKKGEVVARFDDLELKTRLANAEDDRTVAAAKRSKEALLLDTATQDRLRTTAAAERELEMTKTFAKRDTEIFSRDQIIESDIDQRLQGAKVSHAVEARAADRKVTSSKLGIIAVEANKANDAIARSQKGLRSLTIAAPHDGVFTVKRNWWGDPIRIGDTVFRSMSVADVALVAEMEAELYVLEAEASGLAQGKVADVQIEGRDGPPIRGKVKQVETVAKRRQPKSPTQYFGVVLTLDATDVAIMKPGQRVHARLHLHDEEALVVPRPALFDREGSWIAYRRDPAGAFLPAKVTLGASTAGTVTITSGLNEGDVVALRDPGKAPGDLGHAQSASR